MEHSEAYGHARFALRSLCRFPHIDGQQQQIRQSLVRLGGEAALVRLQKALRLPSGSVRVLLSVLFLPFPP